MISKNKIEFLRSLGIKKHRDKNKKSILEGKRLIEEAINFNASIKEIWITEDFLNTDSNFINIVKSHQIKIDIINQKDLKFIRQQIH